MPATLTIGLRPYLAALVMLAIGLIVPAHAESQPHGAPDRAAAPAAPIGAVRSPRGLGSLSLSARFSGVGTAITAGLDWRIFPDRPDQSGTFHVIKEERTATPTFVLPPGGYVVQVSLGLASAAKRVQIGADTHHEVFQIPAGGARFEGVVGDSRIQTSQISFDVYRGSQFDIGDKRPMVADVATGDIVVLPEGAYYVVSNYGDGNAVMRYDFHVQSGKLTDTRINHRAAVITLKLVSDKGGEALANTAWSVLTPGGDVIKESIGAFPTVVLAEGEYVAIARNEGRVFNRNFKVETGVDREIELLAH
jgi:hypothetical protein